MAEVSAIWILAAVVFGACLGVLLVGLLHTAGDPGAARSDIISAYLMGYQDGADGMPADTTRPAELYDWPAVINAGHERAGKSG
jgi:hypothetical protein